MSFVGRRIPNSDTTAEALVRGRESFGLSVAEVAHRTQINSRFILALEQGRYKELPGPVYIRKYVGELCKVYELPFERLEKTLNQEITLTQPKEVRLSPKPAHNPLWIPRLFRWGAVGVLLAVIGAYFTWQVVRLVTPPPLEVVEPSQDIVLDQSVVVVKGHTLAGVQVAINGEVADVDSQGSFEEQVALRPGLNRIEVTAQTKYSSPHLIVRQIVVKNPK